jgi:eukaryotic-like serine/threonine-protein kinase
LAAYVYLCQHFSSQRHVAVKILAPKLAANLASLEQFYREARAAAAGDHPNLVHAYDIDCRDDYHFLVMEFVDGRSLQDMVATSGPMEVTRAAHYIRQAALGLQHLHVLGWVHRNIEPSNILVDRSDVVRILDFGLAAYNDENDRLIPDRESLGTPDYMSPEQAIENSVDIRSDIYSLGATFYFLLTGTAIFGEGTAVQKLLWHQTRQPNAISRFRKDVPEALEAIINRMLAKDRNHRFQTPAMVVEALEAWSGKSR